MRKRHVLINLDLVVNQAIALLSNLQLIHIRRVRIENCYIKTYINVDNLGHFKQIYDIIAYDSIGIINIKVLKLEA